jgi:ABC-type dipeptide/oligopeptide/nickel transport system permease subunit
MRRRRGCISLPKTAWRGPFVYPVRLIDRLDRRYEDVPEPVSVWDAWLRRAECARCETLFLLGTDGLGRDVLSRLLTGAAGPWGSQ